MKKWPNDFPAPSMLGHFNFFTLSSQGRRGGLHQKPISPSEKKLVPPGVCWLSEAKGANGEAAGARAGLRQVRPVESAGLAGAGDVREEQLADEVEAGRGGLERTVWVPAAWVAVWGVGTAPKMTSHGK